jgi:hypothetical protein
MRNAGRSIMPVRSYNIRKDTMEVIQTNDVAFGQVHVTTRIELMVDGDLLLLGPVTPDTGNGSARRSASQPQSEEVVEAGRGGVEPAPGVSAPAVSAADLLIRVLVSERENLYRQIEAEGLSDEGSDRLRTLLPIIGAAHVLKRALLALPS